MDEKTHVLGKISFKIKQVDMKKLIYLLAIFSLFSCEKYDLLKEITEAKEIRPNVYLSPLSPTAAPGAEINVTVQFWSVDDEFNYLGLWHTIDTSTLVQIDLHPATLSYTYEKTYAGKKMEAEEYKEYQFGYDDWSPDNNAYQREVKYLVDTKYKKVSQTQSNTTKVNFVALLPAGFETEFYTRLVNTLSKAKMQILIVDTHALLTQEVFDSKYDAEGKYLEGSADFFQSKLAEIGLINLIGTKYKYEKVHSIAVRFKVINGKNAEGVSSYRSFNVQ
jgi:hypothetical protein